MNQENFLVVAALYKFVSLPDYSQLQTPLLNCCQLQDIKGTILLAPEGINGTIAGSRQGIDTVLAFLRHDPRFRDLEYKESYAEIPPFGTAENPLKKRNCYLGNTRS